MTLCHFFYYYYFLTGRVDSERETERKVFLLPLVHPPMAAAVGALQPAHRADLKAGARCFSCSPMGCRAQAFGPSSTALPGHSRELPGRGETRIESGAPTGTRTWCAGDARRRISLLSHSAGQISSFEKCLLKSLALHLSGLFVLLF